MRILSRLLESIPAHDETLVAAARRHLDTLTKPPGSLGRLEDLAARLSALQGGAPHVDRPVVFAIGEMGIGNTTAASAITAAIVRVDSAHVTGRGTGVDDVTWRRKVGVVRRALAINQPDPSDGLGVLAAVGGFEIAGLVGV